MALAEEERCATCGSGDPVQRVRRGEECGDPYHASAWNDDELHEGPDVPAVPPISETGREFACIDPAELERLRARDEEIDAVVQAWRELRSVQDAIRTGRGLRLGQALDRLTTAHGRVLLFRALDGEKLP